MLRSATMNSLIERDVIVVASAASIYGLGNPEQYKEMIFSHYVLIKILIVENY